jgi:hypothetical protein
MLSCCWVVEANLFFWKRGIFCSGKAVEESGGGVALLRRTTDFEDLRSQGEKGPFPRYGIIHCR